MGQWEISQMGWIIHKCGSVVIIGELCQLRRQAWYNGIAWLHKGDAGGIGWKVSNLDVQGMVWVRETTIMKVLGFCKCNSGSTGRIWKIFFTDAKLGMSPFTWAHWRVRTGDNKDSPGARRVYWMEHFRDLFCFRDHQITSVHDAHWSMSHRLEFEWRRSFRLKLRLPGLYKSREKIAGGQLPKLSLIISSLHGLLIMEKVPYCIKNSSTVTIHGWLLFCARWRSFEVKVVITPWLDRERILVG